jgi:twinkle protein
MQVENREINGFMIDEFNQYGLDVGKTQGICPLCSHDRKPENKKKKCASYDWERGLGTCHNCDSTFQLHTYERKGASDREYVRPSFSTKTHKAPSSKVVEWFKSRGISQGTLEDLNVSEGLEYMPQTGKEENTIKFNYFMGNQLINIKYRDGRKNFKLYKGAEKVFYNINSIVNNDTCVIVEGEIDALSLHEAGVPNVVSVPNGATLNHNNLDYLDNCIDYFEDKTKIILAVDADEPGQMLKQEFIRRLGAEHCYIVDFLDCKDANEYLIKYGSDDLRSAIHTAQQVPLENVTTLKNVEGELKDFVKHGFKPGFQVGLQNFDEVFSTYTGQFITVTGIPSSGKSDFVDQMVVPIYLHAHKLMRKCWGDMPSPGDIGSGKWKEVSEHVNDNFYFIDMDKYSLESVLRKGAELVKRKGIKCLVIDPYNKIRDANAVSDDVNRYTMDYLSKIESFCKKYDVLTFIVAHPTKMPREHDASYHGLLVHRDYEAKNTKVKVLKVKFQNLGENGAESFFTWEPRSGSFVPQVNVLDEKNDSGLPWE